MFRCIPIDLLALIEYCGPYAGLWKLRARGIPYQGKIRRGKFLSPSENFVTFPKISPWKESLKDYFNTYILLIISLLIINYNHFNVLCIWKQFLDNFIRLGKCFIRKISSLFPVFGRENFRHFSPIRYFDHAQKIVHVIFI